MILNKFYCETHESFDEFTKLLGVNVSEDFAKTLQLAQRISAEYIEKISSIFFFVDEECLEIKKQTGSIVLNLNSQFQIFNNVQLQFSVSTVIPIYNCN